MWISLRRAEASVNMSIIPLRFISVVSTHCVSEGVACLGRFVDFSSHPSCSLVFFHITLVSRPVDQTTPVDHHGQSSRTRQDPRTSPSSPSIPHASHLHSLNKFPLPSQITSLSQLHSEFSSLQLQLNKEETEHTWEHIDKALKRFHAVVRGGVTKDWTEEFLKGMREKDLVKGVVRSVSLRSGWSCCCWTGWAGGICRTYADVRSRRVLTRAS